MVANISPNQLRSTQFPVRDKNVEVPAVTRSKNNSEQRTAADTISLKSESSSAVTYSGSLTLKEGDEARFGMLRTLVANLLKEQGINTKIAVGDTEIDLAALTAEDARELISDDGYFGVEQTSERIFQFAVGIAGGDVTRIDAIREGIDKGFAEAKKVFGDWLPDISYATYDAVMGKLDDWVAESKAAA